MSALEKAARAIEESLARQDCYVSPSSAEDGTMVVDGYVSPADLARAVLLAVREADEAEVRQMAEAYGAAFAATFTVRYTAMIDAILSEGVS